MKKSKPNSIRLSTLFLLSIILFSFSVKLFGQNNIISLAPKYLKNGQLFNLPQGPNNGLNYVGQTAENCHNAMQDGNGNLLFFMVDDKLFDKDGFLIDNVYCNNVAVKGTSEIVFVPDPLDCQKYYIIAAGRSEYGDNSLNKIPYLAILDLTAPNIYNSNKLGALTQTSSGTAINLGSITTGYIQNPVKQGFVFIAASKLRNDNSRFVFISSGHGIYRYKIDNTGFHYDNSYLPYSTTTLEQIKFRGEMELIELPNGNYRIASIYPANNEALRLFKADLDNNGNLIPNSNTFYTFPSGNSSAAAICGIEFSPSGDILYVTHEAKPLSPNPIEYIDFTNPGNGFQALNVNNGLDFQFSQIEIGQNSQLYFATNDRIAILSNANTPNANNWFNNAHSLVYSSNYEGYSALLSNSKSFILPDQIDNMDYTNHFFANLQCCLANSNYNASVYIASNSTTWSPSSNPFTNGSATVFIEKELRIPAGINITIENMIFNFAPGAKVIIERGINGLNGGKLTLIGSTFTASSYCGNNQMWLGVQVHGYNNQVQGTISSSQQGWFVMNNSTIEHAMKGVVAVKTNHSNTFPYNLTGYDFSYTGGVIRATNSNFINNRQDIEFRKYISVSNNLSYFSNCNFKTIGALKNPSLYPTYHIMLNDVVGIILSGNTFQNTTPELYSYATLGTGIYTTDANCTVKARCLSSTYPCSSFDPNIFQDLYFGIRSLAINSTRTITVDQNKFINNIYGIYLGGVDFATITKNDFEVYRSAYPNVTLETYGLYLNACTAFTVQENTFTEFNDPGVLTNGNTYGIIVNNSGTLDNEIYKNTFTNIKVGGQSQKINSVEYDPLSNYPNNVGLRWKCNTFQGEIYEADLSITSGRIAYQQGYPINPVTAPAVATQTPAGNQFSHSIFNSQNDISANNSVLAFTYTHHVNLVTKPIYYNSIVVSPIQSFNANYPVYFNKLNSCPSKISSNILLSGTSLKFKSDSLKNVISLKESLIDGGNSGYLLNTISTQNFEEIKSVLLTASPYLTDDVIQAYLAINPPQGDIRDIILENSPISTNISNSITSLSLSQSILDEINQAQTGISDFKLLMNEISIASNERNEIIDNRIRLFLNDTIVLNPLDSIAEILKEEKRELRQKQLCDTYISKGDTLSYKETRDSLVLLYGYDNYVKLADVQKELLNSSSSCYIMHTDQSIRQEVESVAYDSFDRIYGIKGEAYLGLAFDSLFLAEVEPLYAIGSGLRISTFDSTAHDYWNSKSDFTIYPNPSNGTNFSINYIGKEELEDVNMTLCDLNGKPLISKTFENGSGITVDELTNFGSGIYFLSFYKGNQLMETRKIIFSL
ncbi:MAG: T9SS type A sorting domain-containing protein [Sediminibacterium sp.]|jgi:hypothetical protein